MASVSLEGLSSEQIADLAVLAKAQLDSPQTRSYFLRNAKVVNPEVSIPEVDIPFQVQGLMAKSQEQINALQQQLNDERTMRDISQRRETLKSKHSLSDKDIAEVEKLMLEKQIVSHETAAEFYVSQRHSAQPTPSLFAPNTLPKIDLKGSGMPNMNQWSRNEATNVINELRGRIRVG
jgi:hypothetical protein